ncbi:NAD(P)-dependent oxidoreductase [Synechococcus sp. AH-707-M23]|nr:NAD(P)-dependent oxidoreductase [Synechococcus sp. AH-707-M23]
MTAVIVGHTSMLGVALKHQLDQVGEPYLTAGRSADSDIYFNLSVQPPTLSKFPTFLPSIDTIYYLPSSFESDNCSGFNKNLLVNSAGVGYAVMLAELFKPKALIYSGTISSYSGFDPYRGLSSYGLTKRIAEELLDWCANKFGFRFASVRFSQLFDDAGMCISHQPWIGRIIRYAFEKDALYMPSSEGKRNFLHVQDASRLLLDVSRNSELSGILNGCSTQQHSYTELAHTAFSFNECIDRLHISSTKQPFRPICLPEEKTLYELLNQEAMISPSTWIQNISTLKSWSSFGPMDVKKS